MGISEEPEQLRPGKLRAALVLGVPGDDLEAALGSEGLELVAGAGGVLLVGAGAQIGSNVAHRKPPRFSQ
jgi:hypothetical protein